jgi:hypothetical protein
MTDMKFSLRALFVLTTAMAVCAWIASFFPRIALIAALCFGVGLAACGVLLFVLLSFVSAATLIAEVSTRALRQALFATLHFHGT